MRSLSVLPHGTLGLHQTCAPNVRVSFTKNPNRGGEDIRPYQEPPCEEKNKESKLKKKKKLK